MNAEGGEHGDDVTFGLITQTDEDKEVSPLVDLNSNGTVNFSHQRYQNEEIVNNLSGLNLNMNTLKKESSSFSVGSNSSRNSKLSEMRNRLIGNLFSIIFNIGQMQIHGEQGMHASVFKCYKIEDQERQIPYAVKVMREDDEEKILASKKEFEITQRLNHPNIVKSFEIFINDQKKEVHQIMQLIDGKEILDQIAELGAYGEKEAQHIFRQIMEGISYLHDNGICHRDIKPSNILVTKEQKVCIADFNVAREKNAEVFRMMTRTGTLAFSAPEIFTSTYYDEKVDIWSAGTVLYMILSGQQPFEDENVSKLISKITMGDFSMSSPPVLNKISKEARELICKMLEQSPKQRPSAKEVLSHSWFKLDLTLHSQDHQHLLPEVVQDFMERKSLKDQGQIHISQIINVGSIHEEILKKGLEITELLYMKSMANVRSDKFYEESRKQFEEEINSFFKNQTQPDLQSSDDEDLNRQEDDELSQLREQRKQSKQKDLDDKFNALD